MRTWIACVAGLLLASPAVAEVTVTKGKTTAVIRIDGEVAGVYRFGKDHKKPYLIAVSAPGSLEILKQETGEEPEAEHSPSSNVFVAVESAAITDAQGQQAGTLKFEEIVKVDKVDQDRLRLADGKGWISAGDIVPVAAMVTRIVDLDPPKGKDRKDPLYYDHPHHKGVWISVDEVNEIRFWNEDGRIDNLDVEVIRQGETAVLEISNHWIDPKGGKPVVAEKTRVTVFPNRLFVYEITFSGLESPVTFRDTKEGLFAIRLPSSMREFISGGPVVSSEGGEGSKALWGHAPKWIDYVGLVEDRPLGVTIMDAPGNPRPGRYHVRDYGLFSINPFGPESYTKGHDEPQPAAPLTLNPGEDVTFTYGLYIHRGDAEEGQVSKAFEQFVSSTSRDE